MEPSQNDNAEQPSGIYVVKDVLGQEKPPAIPGPEDGKSKPEPVPDARPSRIYMILALAAAGIVILFKLLDKWARH